MSLKRLAVLAVLCLGLLFSSTHEAQAQAASDYASTAYADLNNGYSYAYYAYYNPAYPATANHSFISSVGRRGLANKLSRAVRSSFLSPYEETWAAPDARKDRRSARKSRQEAGRRPPYHSSSPHLERKEP
jgi:hypothetical protein